MTNLKFMARSFMMMLGGTVGNDHLPLACCLALGIVRYYIQEGIVAVLRNGNLACIEDIASDVGVGVEVHRQV